TDPEQAGALLLDLVDQRQVFVTLGILDLIDADRPDRAQLPVLEPPLHDILDRPSRASSTRNGRCGCPAASTWPRLSSSSRRPAPARLPTSWSGWTRPSPPSRWRAEEAPGATACRAVRSRASPRTLTGTASRSRPGLAPARRPS